MKKNWKTFLATVGLMGLISIPTFAAEKISNATISFTETFTEAGEIYNVELTENSKSFYIEDYSMSKDRDNWKPGKKVTFTVTLAAEDGYSFSKQKTTFKVNKGSLIPNQKVTTDRATLTVNYFPKVQLEEPTNIYFEDEYIAVWDDVEYATAYEVRIKDTESNKTKTVKVTKEKIDLSEYVTGDEMTFEVRACAKDSDDAKYILASKWVQGDEELTSSEDNTVTGSFQGKYDNYRFKTSEGTYATGFQYINGRWYYFDSANKNIAVQSTWKDIDGKWYYFNEYCVMQTGWIKVNGEQYYLQSDGIMKTGWLCDGPSGPWYYFDTISGKMLKNTTTPDGYVLNAKGEWRQDDSSSATATTTAKTEADGWHGSGNDWYYTTNNKKVKGWLDLNGKWYFFDKTGQMLYGWQKIEGKWYFLSTAHDGDFGKMVTGWQYLDGNWHYFAPYAGGPLGAMLTGTTTPDGYYVDANGIWK